MDRLRPLDAEMAVLGGVINENANWDAVQLVADDFSCFQNQAVWTAMSELRAAQVPIDEITLEDQLAKAGKLEAVGGLGFLSELGLRCPSKDNVMAYADIIREAKHLRGVAMLAGNMSNRIAAGADADTLKQLLREAVEDIPLATQSTLADLEFNPVTGLPTGLGLERFVPGGIPRDKVTVLYGETGSFKTTVKNALTFNFAKQGLRVLDVSLEDSAELTLARWLAQRHGIPYGKLATKELEAPPLDGYDREVLGRIVDGSRLEPRMERIIGLARRESVSAVVVDYIQLLDGCSGDHEALAEAMRTAQLAAKDQQIAYIFLSQVKQDVNYRATARDNQGRQLGDPRPRINDCLGSSALRTHAKLGLGVFRPWAYCPVPTNPAGPYGDYCKWINRHPSGVEYAMDVYSRLIELSVGKNVLGPNNVKVHCLVNPETGGVEPYEL